MGARFEVHNGDQECDARDRAQHASSPAQHVGGGRIRARAAGSVLSTGLKLLSPAQCLHVSFSSFPNVSENNAGELSRIRNGMNAKTGGCTIAGRPEPGRRDTTLAWGTGSTALFSTASWALLWAVPIRMRSSTDSRCSHGVGCTLPHAHMRANTKHQARMGRNSTRTR